jgi:hypothetical protein
LRSFASFLFAQLVRLDALLCCFAIFVLQQSTHCHQQLFPKVFLFLIG